MHDERDIVAHHECGHAAVALALGKPAHSLELTEGGGGQFREYPVASWEPRDREGLEKFRDAVLASYKPTEPDRAEVLTLVMISFGGILAQRRLCGTSALWFEHWDEHDRRQRHDLAKVVTESDSEARAFLNSAQTETAMIIDSRWQQVTALAGELALRGKLDAAQIKAIIELGPAARRRRAWDQIVAQTSGATLVSRSW
jgi:hypothetical protein